MKNDIEAVFLGLAVGDALGTTLEFKPLGTFKLIEDIVGGGPFNLKPGQWTDDTSLALCLAESLIRKQRFDPIDQLERYVRWWREGYHIAMEDALISATQLCTVYSGFLFQRSHSRIELILTQLVMVH